MAALIAALIASPLTAQKKADAQLSFDVIFGKSPQSSPSQVKWAPDGQRLSYIWTENERKALWLLDTSSGERGEILEIVDSDETEAKGPSIGEIGDHHWSPDGKSLLLESGGGLHLMALAGGKITPLVETENEVQLAKFSPDGKHVGFVLGWNLHVVNIGTGEITQLTEDGEKDVTLNGITDWVYWEELWGRSANGFWWSPDGSRIAYYRFDEREVPSYPMVDFMPGYPEVEWQKYPKAGETNPTVQVGVIALDSKTTTWMATGEETDVYLPRVDWVPGGQRLAVQRLNRDQNRLDLLSCTPSSGACEVLLTESAETWVNVTDDLSFLDDGSFLWTSEASGWRRLAHHAASGDRLRDLTADGWTVAQIDGVDREGEAVIFSAFTTGPLGALHRTLFRQPLGGEPVALSPEDAWSRARVAPDGGRFVHWQDRAAEPTRIVVRGRDGSALDELPTRDKDGVDAAALPGRNFLTIPGPNGEPLPATLITPPGFDPEGSYPAIMYHYGCPASQVVSDRWSTGSRALWHAMMAERGYVILMVDNLGSNFFGKQGEDRAHRLFGPGNLAAQKAGVAALERLGYVDTERIGIWGGSGGGYNTLYVLLNSPGTWRAGVAFAPVTDWRLYDTLWTERYLDHPDDNSDGYDDSSVTHQAAQLADNLLLVHGTADDNVHPQNTLVMARELVAAGKQFEMAIHPRQKHGFRGQDSRHFYERMAAFFDRHLKPGE
jgi:dipeptidyl-peptidase-4